MNTKYIVEVYNNITKSFNIQVFETEASALLYAKLLASAYTVQVLITEEIFN